MSDFMGPMAMAGSIANFGVQLQQRDWMMRAQQIQWDREDKSVQRRVNDLRAAGLSPTLAAGQGASSASPINIGAPQLDTDSLIKALTAQQQIKQSQANIEMTGAQIDKLKADTAYINESKPSRIRGYELDNQLDQIRIDQAWLPVAKFAADQAAKIAAAAGAVRVLDQRDREIAVKEQLLKIAQNKDYFEQKRREYYEKYGWNKAFERSGTTKLPWGIEYDYTY